MLNTVKHNIWQCLISWNQALTTTILSLMFFWEKVYGDETLCCRAQRRRLAGNPWLANVLDRFFALLGDKDHCREAYESEQKGKQLPPEVRQ